MKYKIDNYECEVFIEKKGNKNTYIRIKEDNNIYITTNYLVSKNKIKELLDNNQEFILNNLNKNIKKQEKNEQFYYLGLPYNIIIMPNTNVEIVNSNIYSKSIEELNKWLKKEIIRIYNERLLYNYNLFEEKIPFPNLKIRDMKTRWGVCNKKNNNVTINSQLIKYKIEYLDYVIIHELSHLIHFNHSSAFWKQVEKYCPNYKKIRKELKE